MKKKRVLALTALLLVCVFGISACKKNVGTPEDNPQVNGRRRAGKIYIWIQRNYDGESIFYYA